jgi:NADP-dependent 3-hydroxy acid dehydrogenase YdfG
MAEILKNLREVTNELAKQLFHKKEIVDEHEMKDACDKVEAQLHFIDCLQSLTLTK